MFNRTYSDRFRLGCQTLLWATTLFVILRTGPAEGQLTSFGSATATPIPGSGHDYMQSLNEIVNPADGSLSIRIQADTPKGRGITLPFSFHYDSNVAVIPEQWDASLGSIWTWTTNITSWSNNGWSYALPTLTYDSEQEFQGPIKDGQPEYECWYNIGWNFQDPSGPGTDFSGLTYNYAWPHCTNKLHQDIRKNGYEASIQSSGYVLVDDPNGTVYTFETTGGAYDGYGPVSTELPLQIEDKNGNVINFSGGSGSPAFSATDTLGRTVLNVSGFGNTSSGNTVTVGPLTYTIHWTTVSTAYSVASTQSSLNSGYCGSVAPGAGVSGPVVSDIVLPNGKSYTFHYDSTYGLVDKITYPDGGYVSYLWGTNPLSTDSVYWDAYGIYPSNPVCNSLYDTYAIQKRFVSYDGASIAQEQDFSYSTTWPGGTAPWSGGHWTGKTTNVTVKDFVAGTTSHNSYGYTYGILPTVSAVAYAGTGMPLESIIISSDGSSNPLKIEQKWWADSQNVASESTTLCGTGTTCLAGGLSGSTTSQVYYTPGLGPWGEALSLTEKDEYDLGSSGAVAYPSTPSVAPVRKTLYTDQTFAASPVFPNPSSHPDISARPCKQIIENGSGTPYAETDYYYDGQSTLCGTATTSASTVSVSGLPTGTHDDTYYGSSSTTPRANVTAVTRKCLINCTGETDSTTQYAYDMTGQIVSSTDGCGSTTCSDMAGTAHTTTYSYTDSPSGGNPYGASNAFVTTVNHPAVGGVTLSETYKYNYGTSELTSATDANGQTTSYVYSDSLLRLTDRYDPAVTGGTPHTHYSYVDGSGGSVTVTDPIGTTSKSLFDGMGHTIQTQLTSDPAGTDYVDTVYTGNGDVYSVSDPYRSGTTPAKTGFQYDALGRKSQITHTADSSYTTASYNGGVTTTTDEAGMRNAETIDGLGRLVQVQELGTSSSSLNLVTQYSYDLFDNLIQVNQQGASGDTARVRNFTYDSMSRLITSSNPETGTICYGVIVSSACNGKYDANGNLAGKTDARGVTTSYTYDTLNRLTSKLYSDGTTHVYYGYDGNNESGTPLSSFGIATSNAIGRLSIQSDQTYSGRAFGYDAMGRLSVQTDSTPSSGGWNILSYGGYDLAGHLTSMTYPDGTVVNQGFDAASRLNKVSTGTGASEVDYLASASYFPNGSPSLYTYGNGVTETFGQNSRLQTSAITAANAASYTMLDRTYSYAPGDGLSSCPAAANNGNIWKISDNLNSSWTRQFGYDCVNRLSSAKIGSNTTDYWLDSFGNMSPKVSGAPVYTFDTTTNRVNNLPCHTSGGLSDFDAAGNQLCDSDPYGASRSYAVDAEERSASITMAGGGSPFESYLYSPGGERIRKTASSGDWTEYVYFGGQPVAEKDNTGSWTDYIYAGDKKIARTTANDTTIHIHGTMCPTCISNYEVYFATWINGYVIRSGDSLHVRQYQSTLACGGPDLTFTDGTRLGYSLHDQNGYLINEDGVLNAWNQRDFDLSTYAGKTVSDVLLLAEGCTPPGTWDQWYGDMSVVSADGSVENLWNGQSSVSLAAWSPDPGVTGATYDVSTTGTPTGTSVKSLANRTHYYLDDHLGTAQYELSSAGWPLWQGQFDAYGKELADPAGTVFHYKFTGKERDQESGLDYFGARYYGSSMGRMMSPDWSEQPDTVPYAEFENPQSLNLYSYGRNSPLVYNDPDGHDVRVCDNNGQCNTVSNDAYAAAQKGNNGGLNVPTLNQVGMNGNGSGQFNSTSITDANGNSVGSATYVSNGGADYYANRNGIDQLAQTGATIGSVKGVASFYGASALLGAGVAFSPVMRAGAALTTLSIPTGLTPGAVVGGFTLTAHAVEQAEARGVTLGEIEEAVAGVAKSNPQNGWDSVQRFYTSTCEVRVNKITGTIVTVISKIKR